jgi:plasmid stabilization system protein ParE
MSLVRFSPAALRDLTKLREFLRSKNSVAAKRAAQAIIQAIKILEEFPFLGRVLEDLDDNYRELLIGFGESGYLALYRYEDDIVTILAIRHQKESGYDPLP